MAAGQDNTLASGLLLAGLGAWIVLRTVRGGDNSLPHLILGGGSPPAATGATTVDPSTPVPHYVHKILGSPPKVRPPHAAPNVFNTTPFTNQGPWAPLKP